MTKVNTKIGDVFCAKLDNDSKKYLQYIVNDLTQLNSDVIRVFKQVFPIDATPDLTGVVNGEVEFYAHCVTKWGVKLGCWEKIGNIKNIGKIDVLFRSSDDDGNLEIKVSNNWWVWKINEEQRKIGELTEEYQKAEIGSVIPPDSIVHRMRTGKYDFTYPKFNTKDINN